MREAFKDSGDPAVLLKRVETLSGALECLDQAGTDIVLLDLSLPDSQGLETFTRIHGRFPDIPVVVVSGLDDESVAVKAVQGGAQDYIVKGRLDRPGLLRVIRYSAERKRAQQAFLASIVEFSDDAIIGQDLEGLINSWNRGGEKVYGYKIAEVKGKPISILFTSGNYDGALAQIDRIKKGEPSVSFETFHLTRDGQRINVALTISPIKDALDQLIGVSTISRNITDHKRAEEELLRSHAQLRDLAAHLQTIREEERTEIAREIHDDLGQMLAGLKMELYCLKPKVGKKTVENKINSLLKLISKGIDASRRICARLRPVVLDDLGLTAAMAWEAKEFEGRPGIECQMRLRPPDTPTSRDCSTAIYRIFQEALSNIARHAQAKNVKVLLKEEGGCLILEIQDDGMGIEEARVSSSQSLGLVGMRERALAHQGTVVVSGKPRQGTTVRLAVPLVPKEKEAPVS
jgi:two-component system sensor histidine kinase UhpB